MLGVTEAGVTAVPNQKSLCEGYSNTRPGTDLTPLDLMAFTRNNLQRKRSGQRGVMHHVRSLHRQGPGIHAVGTNVHSGPFRGHRSELGCCPEILIAAEHSYVMKGR